MYGLTVIVVAQWLLNHNADVNDQQVDGWTALHLAAFNKKLEVVQMQLDHNTGVNF